MLRIWHRYFIAIYQLVNSEVNKKENIVKYTPGQQQQQQKKEDE